MEVFKILTSNYLINVGFTAWMTAQIAKTILVLISTRKLELERMVGAGGMPSAHSALVCSIAVAMSRKMGFSSPEFALALSFAGIVMYDAMGVRRAAGEQAKVLNLILHNLRNQSEGFWSIFNWMGDSQDSSHTEEKETTTENDSARAFSAKLEDNEELQEYLGHTPLQVLAGALLGILIAMVMPVT